MKTRDYQIDNIKGLLIILVVFGHMLLATSREDTWLTTLIYSFHMPAFIFLNGLFSKSIRIKRVVYFGFLYLLVQTVYILIVTITKYPWIPESNNISIPIFHVWYLLSLTIWYFLSIILKRFSLPPVFILALVSLCALLVRFINFGVEGNYFAYARTVVFAPFFFAGYFTPINRLLYFREKLRNFKLILIPLIILLIALNVFYFENNAKEWMRLFFGYVNYLHFSNSHLVFLAKEILQYFLGTAGIFILLAFVPSNKGVMNYIGHHTLAIFICHPVLYFMIYNYAVQTDSVNLKPIFVSMTLAILAIIWSLVVEQILSIVKQLF